jgi:Tol biopolymer transport system component
MRRVALVCLVLVTGLAVASGAAPAGGRVAAFEGGYDPVWSADGTQVAYIGPIITAHGVGSYTPRHVDVVPVDGSAAPHSVASVAEDVGPLEELRWATGNRLVYQDANFTLWDALPGKAAKRLVVVGAPNQAFALSSNGRRVAFTAPCGCSIRQGSGVAIVAAAGGAVLRLHRAANEVDYDPSFSPDGRRLVFSRVLIGKGEPQYPKNDSLVVEPVQGGPERSLHVIGDHAAYSPDGRWLAFFDPRGLEAMPSSGGTPRLLRPSAHLWNELAFSWSHDSTRLAYAIGTRLGIVDLSGKAAVLPLPDVQPRAETPQWSPDDASIVFSADFHSSADVRVYVIRADGSGLRRIA